MLCVPLSFAFRRILSALLFLTLLDFESALSDRRHIEPVPTQGFFKYKQYGIVV